VGCHSRRALPRSLAPSLPRSLVPSLARACSPARLTGWLSDALSGVRTRLPNRPKPAKTGRLVWEVFQLLSAPLSSLDPATAVRSGDGNGGLPRHFHLNNTNVHPGASVPAGAGAAQHAQHMSANPQDGSTSAVPRWYPAVPTPGGGSILL